jgi:hypothetical protein
VGCFPAILPHGRFEAHVVCFQRPNCNKHQRSWRRRPKCWTRRGRGGRTRSRSNSADRKRCDRRAFCRRVQKRLTPCPAEQLNSESGPPTRCATVAMQSMPATATLTSTLPLPTRRWRSRKNGCAGTVSAQLRARTNSLVMGTKIALMEDGPGSYRFAFSSKRGEVSGRVTVGVEGPPDKRSDEDREQAAKNQILALSREFSEACEQ